MYHQQLEEVADIGKSYQWLDKAGLEDSTETLIMAVQEQALSTRSTDLQHQGGLEVQAMKRFSRVQSG